MFLIDSGQAPVNLKKYSCKYAKNSKFKAAYQHSYVAARACRHFSVQTLLCYRKLAMASSAVIPATGSSHYFISPVKKNGKRKLVDSDRNIYVEDKSAPDVKYFRCHRNRSECCQGRGILREGLFEITRTHSSHVGNGVKAEAIEIRSKLHKLSIQNKYAPPSAIVQEVASELSQEAVVTLPSNMALKRDVQRARRLAFGVHTGAKTMNELIVPEAVKFTKRGDEFLWYDSYCDDVNLPRIIIFAIKDFLEVSRAYVSIVFILCLYLTIHKKLLYVNYSYWEVRIQY